MRKILIGAALGVLLTIAQAKAVTYNYIGNPDSNYNNDYLTATVDVGCVGTCNGSFSTVQVWVNEGQLNSYSMTLYNKANMPIFSVSSSDADTYSPNFDGSYVTLDKGAVTFWGLYLFNSSKAYFLATAGLSTYGPFDIAYDGPANPLSFI